MKNWPTIYKLDTKGNHRIWRVEQDGNRYWTIAGLIDGERVTSTPTTCAGKNLGRSNETSPEAQATTEVEAKYTKKLKGDYHTDIGDVKKIRFIKPMLAEKVQDFPHKMIFPGYTQFKLNGARAVAQISGLTSRKGEIWKSTPHVLEVLKEVFEKIPGVIFDGELYCDTFAHDLGSTMSLIRKQKPTKEELAASAEVVVYNVFDLISDGTPGYEATPFSKRMIDLQKIFETYILPNEAISKYIKLVPSKMVRDMDEVKEMMTSYLAKNYEGLIFRNANAPYEFKRTTNLFKYKNFQDAEYLILDVYEGIGNRSGMCGAFLLGDEHGRAFKSTPKGNRDYFREILQNKDDYRERLGTVKFIELTPKQPKEKWKEFIDYKGRKWNLNTGEVPYHGVVVAVREDI